MKKVLFSVIGLLLAFAYTANADIEIHKRNGGKHGYRDIDEGHSGNNHVLNCAEPGNEQCKWDTQPSGVNTFAIAAVVEDQLGNGNTSGSGISSEGYEYTWSGTDIYNYDIYIIYDEEL